MGEGFQGLKAPRGWFVYVAAKAATHKATTCKAAKDKSRDLQSENRRETYWLLC
jgi:hypothetical protein